MAHREWVWGAFFMVSLGAVTACPNTPETPITDVTGTWGGENAGFIATDTSAHVHIGCTVGDTNGRVTPDAEGRFSKAGVYNVDAFPIDRGITHPARFTGQISGRTMTLTVVLTDTGRQLGPVTLVLGKEPKMGPCPICRVPKSRLRLNDLPRRHEATKIFWAGRGPSPTKDS